MCQVYKILHGLDRVEPLFEMAADGERATRAAADPLNVRIPRARLEIRKNFFTIRVAEHWNRIQTEIKDARSDNSFKRLYKAHRWTSAATA